MRFVSVMKDTHPFIMNSGDWMPIGNRNSTQRPFQPEDRRYMDAWQFFVTFLGWLSDLLERLSDLQLGDQKVTLNHLVKRILVSKKVLNM